MKRITINHERYSYELWDSVIVPFFTHSGSSNSARHDFSESTLTYSNELAGALMGGHVMPLIFGMNETCLGNKISLRY